MRVSCEVLIPPGLTLAAARRIVAGVATQLLVSDGTDLARELLRAQPGRLLLVGSLRVAESAGAGGAKRSAAKRARATGGGGAQQRAGQTGRTAPEGGRGRDGAPAEACERSDGGA